MHPATTGSAPPPCPSTSLLLTLPQPRGSASVAPLNASTTSALQVRQSSRLGREGFHSLSSHPPLPFPKCRLDLDHHFATPPPLAQHPCTRNALATHHPTQSSPTKRLSRRSAAQPLDVCDLSPTTPRTIGTARTLTLPRTERIACSKTTLALGSSADAAIPRWPCPILPCT